MTHCPCNNHINFTRCCGLYLEGKQNPPTPEALMRSRYTAYSLADINYIKRTMHGEAAIGFNEVEAKQWAGSVTWLGLDILNTSNENPGLGYVEFIARYIEGDKIKTIHEISEFQLDHGVWFYVNGIHPEKSAQPIKIARNNPCPCGSLKKFKNCHGH